MTVAARRAALIDAFCELPVHMRDRLEGLKRTGNALRQRNDLLWYLLLQSASTQGNSRGWQGLFGNADLLASVEYGALSFVEHGDREALILNALRVAKVRMPTQKAIWLAANFNRIAHMGGVAVATQQMLGLPDRNAKYEFITQFDGIGKKYGRNIWMDIYDPCFRGAIAVDERVKKVSGAIGLETRRYNDIESFFVSCAQDSGLEPWEVDRLLYNFTDHFLSVIAYAA
jgi:hypothetical protein